MYLLKNNNVIVLVRSFIIYYFLYSCIYYSKYLITVRVRTYYR